LTSDGAITGEDPFAPPLHHKDFKVNGLALGFHAGYNWQAGQWVYGIEGDVTITPGWNDKLTNTAFANENTTLDGSLFAQTQIDWLSSIRGRLGMTFNRTLIYATGGIAWARGSYTAGSSTPGQDSRHRFTATGGVVGGGAEWKATPNVSFRIEGLYYIFDRKTDIFVPSQSFNPPATFSNVAGDYFKFNNIGVVRVGVSWHLPQVY
jgi:outer membrane immunogenic protein